jgi:ABC-type spermidine/putrescine transport system permease subunit I
MIVWFVLVMLPLLLLVVYTFLQSKGFRVVWEPTFATWGTLFESGRWLVTVRTLRIAFTITAIELIVAFPFALWLAKGCRSQAVKAIVLAALTVPFFLDLSSRTVVWRAILGRQGLLNTGLMELGLTDAPIDWLLFSEFTVHFGMLAPYFPTMVFPIFLILSLVDDEYIQASQDLGASPLQTFVYVIFPLSLPGIMAGIVFTLVPTMAEYVVPALMGGYNVNMLGHSVENALTALKYPTAAALSTFIILLLGALLALLARLMRRAGGLTGVFDVLQR